MPFTTLQNIKPFISKPLYTFLSSDNNFPNFENQAALLIRDICNIPIPADINLSPDFIHYPMAVIIQKLTIPFFPDLDPEAINTIVLEYEHAFIFLNTVKNPQIIFTNTFIDAQTW